MAIAYEYRYVGQPYNLKRSNNMHGPRACFVEKGMHVAVTKNGDGVRDTMTLDPDIKRGGAEVINIADALRSLPDSFWLSVPSASEVWYQMGGSAHHKNRGLLAERCPWVAFFYGSNMFNLRQVDLPRFEITQDSNGDQRVTQVGPIYKVKNTYFAAVHNSFGWVTTEGEKPVLWTLPKGAVEWSRRGGNLHKDFYDVWNRVRSSVIKRVRPHHKEATKIKKAVAREQKHLKHRTLVLSKAAELRSMLDELEASVKDDVTTRDFLGSFYYSSTELCQTLTNWKSAVKGRIPKDVAALEVMKRKNVLDVVTRREAEPETSSDKDAK